MTTLGDLHAWHSKQPSRASPYLLQDLTSWRALHCTNFARGPPADGVWCSLRPYNNRVAINTVRYCD